MSIHRVGKRLGRPLKGSEPLDARLTVMVTTSMLSRVESRGGAEFVRAALRRALGGGGRRQSRNGFGRKTRGVRRVKRYGK